jgi:hypothetical protein
MFARDATHQSMLLVTITSSGTKLCLIKRKQQPLNRNRLVLGLFYYAYSTAWVAEYYGLKLWIRKEAVLAHLKWHKRTRPEEQTTAALGRPSRMWRISGSTHGRHSGFGGGGRINNAQGTEITNVNILT